MDFSSGAGMLSGGDYAVLGGLVALLFWIGSRFTKEQTSTDQFFLGGRSVPWWAAGLSFIATEISAVTIISVPAVAYTENWQYGQFFIGSALSRLIIAYLFIPAFYRYQCVTIYEFLKHRFGPQTQYTATAFFFVTRLLGSGVRLMAACLAVSVLMGWPIIPVILLFTLISIVYIAFGGIKAVVWTNVLQAVTFLGAGAVTIGFLYHRIHGGLPEIWRIADGAGRLSLVNWGPSIHETGFWKTVLTDPNIFWIAVLNGFFGSMAAFGTDQELMQRLLTVETRGESQKTMALTPLGSLLVLLIYLSIGTGLFVFYQQHPELPLPDKLDKIFPHFIGQVMPAMMRGFVMSAIVMASIDSPLASLSSSFVTDIYRPLIRSDAPDAHYVRLSRICVVVFGLILAVLAYGFSFFEKILWLAFKIGGVTFGSLLGVFLLGLLTKRHANRANTVSMIFWALVNLVLLILSELKIFPIGWSWLVLLGTFGTFTMSWLLAPVLDKESEVIPA